MSDRYVWVFPPRPPVGERWEWPAAFYNGPNRKMAAMIVSEESYNPFYEKMGAHMPVGVIVKRYNLSIDVKNEGRNMLSDHRFSRLRFAIEFAQEFLDTNPDWKPKII